MRRPKISIIDYGMGNIWSVLSAFKYLGVDVEVINDPDEIVTSSSLVLPGVGSFRKAMDALKSRGMDEAIMQAVNIKGSKLLGVCLGMQLMGKYSTEDGYTQGLCLIENGVERFSIAEIGKNKLPHVGFNPISIIENSGIFSGLSDSTDFYFTHSYRMLVDELKGRYATCDYGVKFLAAFEHENIYGTQFHPEKSQSNGLVLLKNFIEQLC